MFNLDNLVCPHALLLSLTELSEFKERWPLLSNLPGSILENRISECHSQKISSIPLISFPHSLITDATSSYYKLQKFILTQYKDIVLNETVITQFHKMLCTDSFDLEKLTAAETQNIFIYKKKVNNIIIPPLPHTETLDNDNLIKLKTASPEETPTRIKALLKWVNSAIAEEQSHPIIIISIFTVIFRAIYPFDEQNDPLCRILTTLLLLKSNYQFISYASLDNLLELNKEKYHQNFYLTQLTLRQSCPNFIPWISFFSKILVLHKRQVEEWVQQQSNNHHTFSSLHPLKEEILTYLKNLGKTTIGQLENLTGANRNTLKKHLAQLVLDIDIKQHGKGPATWYTLP